MKEKILNLCLILSSLVGYLEWGNGDENRRFLFQAEAEIILKFFKEPLSVIHPFTILPMLGQILLLITLFQKKPKKIFTFPGLIFLSILLLLIFLIGILTRNSKIAISAIPFIITGIITLRHYRKRTTPKEQN